MLGFEKGSIKGYGDYLSESEVLKGRKRLAHLLHREGNPKAAISVLAKGIKEHPASSEAYYALATYVARGAPSRKRSLSSKSLSGSTKRAQLATMQLAMHFLS